MDETLFRVINDGLSSPMIGWLMVRITTPETWWAPLALLAGVMVAFDRKRGLTAVVTAMLVVGAGDALTHYMIKPFFGRIRPCHVLENVHLLVGCGKSLSFPSSHAVNSMALAGVIGGFFRPLLYLLLPITTLVCVSRMAVGVHYPSDVLAGALFGFGLGWGGAMLARKVILDKRGDG